jgi:glycosyltransferase involved in cell wall biosynthesis
MCFSGTDAKVSVICNTYNHARYIRDALEGFVMQETDFPFEVLVHDDASTDDTAQIIREYERKYPELIKPVYETENQYSKRDGTIFRLQNARARGKYIALCEGDDYWTDPKKLQKQYDFMESHPEYTLCGCSTRWLNDLTGKIQNRGSSGIDRDFTLSELLLPKNGRPFQTASFFFRADVYKSRPSWGFPVGDLPLTYYAAMKGKVHMLADEMCVYLWFSEGSWTARAYNDETRSKYYLTFVQALEKMNRDTDYRYDELIQKKIRNEKYELALTTHDFKAIRNGELKELYKRKKWIYRIKDRIHCTMPGLYNVIMKAVSNMR